MKPTEVEQLRKEVRDYTIIIVEHLIEEIERQGKTSVTVTTLRKFIQNIELNNVVVGKKYVKDREKYGT